MRIKLLFLLACAILCCHRAQAQVAPSVTGGDRHLWVGAEYSNFSPDWAPQPPFPGASTTHGITRLPGVGIDTEIGLRRRFGLEGEVRLLNFNKPDGLTEKSYQGGAYYTAYQRGKLSLTGKFLVAGVQITYSPAPYIGYGSYVGYVPGLNLDYRLAHKWKARLEYEYESIPSAPGLGPTPNSGLRPNGFSGGVSYRVF